VQKLFDPMTGILRAFSIVNCWRAEISRVAAEYIPSSTLVPMQR
jgi:hypothetical protein